MSIEIERKYIIAMPNFDEIKTRDNYKSSEILQIYLNSDKGVTHRVRKRNYGDRISYTETKKVRIDKMSAIEDEREITASEFDALSENIREGSRPLTKVRYTFDFSGLCFEIDVYPEWKQTSIMELELESEDKHFEIPPFIRVIREVTGDKKYSNSSMSQAFPREELV